MTHSLANRDTISQGSKLKEKSGKTNIISLKPKSSKEKAPNPSSINNPTPKKLTTSKKSK